MGIEIGKAAPEFNLFDTEKNKISLSSFRGKNLLILFFPQAFTGVCTKELCSVNDDISRYNKANAEVIGISVDSVFTLKRFREERHYNFHLLSDFNKEVSALYECLYDNWILEMKGVSKRSAFVVDKTGIIRYAEVLESAGELPNFESINQKLNELS